VRGPNYVIAKGKTPVLTAEEARQLLDTILPARATVLAVDAERRTLTVKLEDGGKEKTIDIGDEMRLLGETKGTTFQLRELVFGDKLRLIQRDGVLAALRRGWPDDAIARLRDRALIAVMVYSFARIGAVLAMNVNDYHQQGKRWWLRLHEKGGKDHQVPAHHKLEKYLDAYIAAAGIDGQKGTPLFRSLDRHRQLTTRRLDDREALAMIKRRARAAGLGDELCCHTFRATGITNYLENDGTLEVNQPYYLPRQSYPNLRFLEAIPREPVRYLDILLQLCSSGNDLPRQVVRAPYVQQRRTAGSPTTT
jgi:hypothetical protein